MAGTQKLTRCRCGSFRTISYKCVGLTGGPLPVWLKCQVVDKYSNHTDCCLFAGPIGQLFVFFI